MHRSTLRNGGHLCLLSFALIMLAIATYPAPAILATFDVYPEDATDCNEDFENMANSLQPGDELIVHDGTYSQNCRRYITLHGTAANPIVIRAADGASPILTRPDDPSGPQSNSGIEVSGEYFVIRGLHFMHGDAGFRIMPDTHHLTLEDCEISQTSNNGITLNSGNTDSITIRRNHIHHTGLKLEIHDTTEGEGMYVGCNGASCRATNHIIEGNYIHDLRSTSNGGNDGIEIKYGSYGNIVRDNVIHNTTIGTRYPCILVYGHDQTGGQVNVVEGNALWNCGEAIQVVSDAIVRNNLILNSDQGVTAAPHGQVPTMRNVTIVNNTIYGHSGNCMYINWGSATGMTLAGNAIYCDGGTAISNGSGLGGATVLSNYVSGGVSGGSIDDAAFFDGGASSDVFNDPAGLDFWPKVGAVIIGKADGAYVPQTDFNGAGRATPSDVGAYETAGSTTNPGWTVGPGFKNGSTSDTAAPAAPTGVSVK